MKIHHFFHIYADADANAIIFLVNQHLVALRAYGLGRVLTSMQVGIVGKPENRARIKEFIAGSGFPCTIGIERDTGFEQVTQSRMFEHAQENNGYYLYTHTKGASNLSIFNQCWSRSMEFHTVVQWRQAVQKLEVVDAVGCHWITKEQYPMMADQNNPNGHPYFGGNFWWARASVVRELGLPDPAHRWCAEHWIGKKPGLRVHDACPGWPDSNRFFICF